MKKDILQRLLQPNYDELRETRNARLLKKACQNGKSILMLEYLARGVAINANFIAAKQTALRTFEKGEALKVIGFLNTYQEDHERLYGKSFYSLQNMRECRRSRRAG